MKAFAKIILMRIRKYDVRMYKSYSMCIALLFVVFASGCWLKNKDTTPPTVTFVNPANLATDVPINRKIAASFSEAMRPRTITMATFTLKQGTTAVTGTVAYADTTATFSPASDLEASTVYTATITTGAKDRSGNALGSPYVWSFTTGTNADTTPPTVTLVNPRNLATDVAINRKIAATFSETMDPLSINQATFTIEQGTTPVKGKTTYAGNTAIFSPARDLETDTVYTATITTGAKDLAGIELESTYVWSFTTGTTPDTTPPTITSTNPADKAPNVSISKKITATFSEAMDDLTITTANYTVTGPDNLTSVAGTVDYDLITNVATFIPDSYLTPDTTFTATITTGVKDLAGNALASAYVWTFHTNALPANPTPPVLGESGRFVILASQKITTTPGSVISNGDMGIEDQARSYYEGFTAGVNPGQFTELTNGLSYAHDDTDPALIPSPYASTVAFINQVRTDLGIAYTYLAADPNPSAPTQVCPTELGGQNLTRGVYKTAADVTIQTDDLTLDGEGDPDSVWIFTIDGTFTTGAPGGNIILANEAQAKNVYWRSAGIAAIGEGTTFYGNVFAWEQVNVTAGAAITGRLFSVNEQVTLISDTVTKAP